MNSNGKIVIAQNGQKRLIFIMVSLIRIKNIKERRKANRKIYSNYKRYT